MYDYSIHKNSLIINYAYKNILKMVMGNTFDVIISIGLFVVVTVVDNVNSLKLKKANIHAMLGKCHTRWQDPWM